MQCHNQSCQLLANESPVILVGNPNVGKSVLFGALTGHYVTVSNYSGTTVEIAKGTLCLNGHPRPVIDTPGIHSITPLSDDERVTRDILLTNSATTVLQVVDMKNLRRDLEQQLGRPLAYLINCRRLAEADLILEKVVRQRPARPAPAEALGRWMIHPMAGWPILALVLYLLYLFVGVLGAGTLVDLIETHLFEALVNPWAAWLVETLIPIPLIQEFLVGPYGLITMALTYSLAIVLPIVGTFFLAFSLLEDSGYLSRLAVMLDRTFRLMGLNGKAVVPMILGLGCVTMATMTTRILESRKERLQVTLLLALGVPCSAQLGVILGMIAGIGPLATLIWSGMVIATLLGVGYLAAQVIPGRQSDFILELPPIRVPSLKNILVKTLARMEWYLKEVVPVFVFGTIALFLMDKVGLLSFLEELLSPLVVGWLNLPAQVTGVLLVGFLRRDYGAAGLFTLARAGVLSPLQIVVSVVMITLFMPCIASLLMIAKEYGARTAALVAAFVFPFAFAVGGLLNLVLGKLGIF